MDWEVFQDTTLRSIPYKLLFDCKDLYKRYSAEPPPEWDLYGSEPPSQLSKNGRLTTFFLRKNVLMLTNKKWGAEQRERVSWHLRQIFSQLTAGEVEYLV